MLTLYIITATIFTLTVKTEGLQCFVEGTCVGATEFSTVIVDTINNCVDQCQNSTICKFSTFDSNNNYCKKFKDICSEINMDEFDQSKILYGKHMLYQENQLNIYL